MATGRKGPGSKAIRYIAAALSMAAFLMLPPESVSAFDITDDGYSGVVDTYTGQAVGESTTASLSDRVQYDATLAYDRPSSMFIYMVVGLGSEISISVCNGMYTTDPVRLNIPSEVKYALYRDGKQLEYTNGAALSEAGAYVLDLTASSTNGQTISWWILPTTTGSVTEYRLPSGFLASEVTLNGEAYDQYTPGVIPMQQEGLYEVTYYCQWTGIPYKLGLNIDHTAPEVTLEGVVDGVAKGPVNITGLEENDSLYVELDGESLGAKKKLTQSGAYLVNVADVAGNTNTYNFRIQIYFNLNAWVFVGMALVLVATVVGYIIFSRKRLRVR